MHYVFFDTGGVSGVSGAEISTRNIGRDDRAFSNAETGTEDNESFHASLSVRQIVQPKSAQISTWWLIMTFNSFSKF